MVNFKFNNSLDNFEDIVQNIKDYFISLNYTFANGGNFDLLARLFAWYKMSTGQDISNVVNNLYISSANNKESVFELAKNMGYVVRRNIPSRVKCKLVYNGTQNVDFTAKNIIVTGKNNNLDFSSNNVKFNLSTTSNKYETIVDCQQKTLKTFSYLGTGIALQNIVLPETNITDDPFTISSSIGSVTYTWELAQTFGSIPSPNSSIYFLKMNNIEQTEISFGNSIIGRIPQSNELITIQYYITGGVDADNEDEFFIKNITVQSNNNDLNIITNYTLTTNKSFGSSGNESNDEIANNSSKYFSTLGNNIVRQDFENLLQIESDYVAFSNISNDESSDTILSSFYFLLVPNNYINISIINASNTNTLPFEAIDNLVVSTIEYSKFDKYFSDWIYLTIASPTYLYYDILPQIQIEKYKNFESVSNKVHSDLNTYITNYLYGFNKSYRETSLTKIIKTNTDVLDVKINNNYYIVFSRANIIDKKRLKIPPNFVKNNMNHYNDLVNYGSYIYSYLKDEDKTIHSDDLKISDENFNRYFVSTNEVTQYNIKKLFDLTFLTTPDYSIIEDMSQIYRLEINSVYIDIVVLPIISGISDYSLYYSGESNIQQGVPTFNISTTTKYLVYLKYNGVNFLFAEIKEIADNNGLKIVEPITNLFYVQTMFSGAGIILNTNDEFLTFNINKTINENNETNWILTANIKISSKIVNETQTNLLLVSRKEVCNYDFSTNILTQIDDVIIANNIVESNINKINLTINNVSVGKIIRTDTTLSVDLLSLANYPVTDQFKNYKDKKITVEQNENIYRVFVHEIVDSSIIATIDNISGTIYFLNNITYKKNEAIETFLTLTLDNILKRILEDGKNYRLRLISKNDIPTFTNITDNFDSNDNIFCLPNLGLITEYNSSTTGITNG